MSNRNREERLRFIGEIAGARGHKIPAIGSINRAARGDDRLWYGIKNARGSKGRTALMYAAYKGDITRLKWLIKQRADINAADDRGYTALMYACDNCHIQCVKAICDELDADINAEDWQGMTAIMHAGYGFTEDGRARFTNGGAEIVIILKKRGADINKRATEDSSVDYDKNLIMLHCGDPSYGTSKSVALLLEQGADIHSDLRSYSLLYQACGAANPYVIDILVDGGLDINGGLGVNNNLSEDTPLMDCVRMYCGPQFRDITTEQQPWYRACVKRLCEKGADPNIVDINGCSPLHLVCAAGDIDTIPLLIDIAEADVNAQDDEGNTPLLLAARKGHSRVVMLLCDTYKANINIENEAGDTPSSIATGLAKVYLTSRRLFSRGGRRTRKHKQSNKKRTTKGRR